MAKHGKRVKKKTIQFADSLYFYNKYKIIAGIQHSEGTNDQSLMQWVMNELREQNGDMDDFSAKGILSGLIIGGSENTAVTLYALRVYWRIILLYINACRRRWMTSSENVQSR